MLFAALHQHVDTALASSQGDAMLSARLRALCAAQSVTAPPGWFDETLDQLRAYVRGTPHLLESSGLLLVASLSSAKERVETVDVKSGENISTLLQETGWTRSTFSRKAGIKAALLATVVVQARARGALDSGPVFP